MDGKINQPYLSVDTVGLRVTADTMEVLLVRRTNPPYRGEFALPGVLLLPGETIDYAARRALLEKAEIIEKPRGFSMIGVFDETNRDPRGAIISCAMLSFFPGSAPTGGEWHDANKSKGLPFDHDRIISAALKKSREASAGVVRGILGDTFLGSDYALMIENSGGKIDRTNLSRIIEARLPVSRDGEGISPFTRRRGTKWKFNS